MSLTTSKKIKLKYFTLIQGSTICQEGGRYKLVSDGDNNNMIMLAITKVKTTDEGEYRVVVENEHGSDEKSFMLYVSDSSGMDFRSMLKKKKYAKWGNDDQGPDWGDLKHHDKEEEPCLKEVKPVSQSYCIWHGKPNIIIDHIHQHYQCQESNELQKPTEGNKGEDCSTNLLSNPNVDNVKKSRSRSGSPATCYDIKNFEKEKSPFLAVKSLLKPIQKLRLCEKNIVPTTEQNKVADWKKVGEQLKPAKSSSISSKSCNYLKQKVKRCCAIVLYIIYLVGCSSVTKDKTLLP